MAEHPLKAAYWLVDAEYTAICEGKRADALAEAGTDRDVAEAEASAALRAVDGFAQQLGVDVHG